MRGMVWDVGLREHLLDLDRQERNELWQSEPGDSLQKQNGQVDLWDINRA